MADNNTENNKTYEIFDKFLKDFIIDKKFCLFGKGDEKIPDVTIKNVKGKIIGNLIEGNDSFTEKISKQIAAEDVDERNLIRHIVWLWALPAEKLKTYKNEVNVFLDEHGKIESGNNVSEVYKNAKGVVSGGQYYNTNKFAEIMYLLFLIKKIWDNKELNDITNVKENIKDLISKKEIESDEDFIKNVGKREIVAKNLLLNLCYPDVYPRIAVSSHRKAIIDVFGFLLEEEDKDGNSKTKTAPESDNQNRNLKSESPSEDDNQKQYLEECEKCQKILKKIKEDGKSIWEPPLSYFWRKSSDADFSEENALRFKKSIILFGPPGTSKTYSAETIAKTFILQELLREYKGKKKEIYGKIDAENQNSFFDNHIHQLQLHSNYTYEDFIWGYQIEGNESKPKKGYLLNLIDEIKDEEKDKKSDEDLENLKRPHVLILDEINRVDLSRLFGELFSAIENRDKEIELPVKFEDETKSIKLPDNLYIIGTMNEIDFSLERVDFALRRRFVWFFKGYNDSILYDIIKDKFANESDEETIIEFIENCSGLNKKISNDSDLGEQYQIGHTFFSDIVSIYEAITNSPKKIKKSSMKTAKEILWKISIKPMIEAYLGNLDNEEQKTKLESFKKAFGIS